MVSFRDRPYAIASYPCLTLEECEAIAREVREVLPRAYHQVLTTKNEIYTIGAPYFILQYLKHYSLEEYFTLTRKMNSLLRDHFQSLFDKVAKVIFEETGLPAEAYPSETSPLPGIQVYPPHPYYTTSRHWHFDNCIHLEDSHKEKDQRPLSAVQTNEYLVFILCLRAPQGGAYMRMKDAKLRDWEGVPRQELLAKTTDLPEYRHEYPVGYLNIHSGQYLHAGGFVDGTGPDDLRICYQGAAILKNNRWQLFWG